MPKRIAASTLQANTITILNTIRQNASAEYQQFVPTITSVHDIPKVGEVLYGYPALSNQFVNSLINQIAFVLMRSATFNNPYADLKKGELTYGETIEEIFVELAKPRAYMADNNRPQTREFARTLPDVKAAFHAINWRVQYPVTVQEEDVRQAFRSEEGVRDLVMKVIDSVYRAAEYDEYLLFKWMIIKGINQGKFAPVVITVGSGQDANKAAAAAFRAVSNTMLFPSTKYNLAQVRANTPKDDQYIFMDAEYNATFDVEVLSAAFNMDKAEYFGHLKLIDDWTTFDNERLETIINVDRELGSSVTTDMISKVTDAELSVMADVKAVLVDRNWFQVYDVLNRMTDKEVASGIYWNYFYNCWKVVSSSPFSNAVAFLGQAQTAQVPTAIVITGKAASGEGTIYTLDVQDASDASIEKARFVQTEDLTEAAVAVKPYGLIIVPDSVDDATITLTVEYGGTLYDATFTLADDVGDDASLSEQE